jgi:hypothetical protein
VEEVVKWRAEGILTGWRKHGEFRRELCGDSFVFGGREVEEKAKRPGRGVWQNQPELYRLKHASPLQRPPMYFKRYNSLVCRVAS